MAQHKGSCLCGAITYQIEDTDLRPVIACHCIQCRKTTGHHVAATSAPREKVTITGEPHWFQSSAEARRGFCPTCGSQLFWDGPGRNLAIMAGTLDGETGLSLSGHIFTDFKGDYYEIDDDLPNAPGDHPALTVQVDP